MEYQIINDTTYTYYDKKYKMWVEVHCRAGKEDEIDKKIEKEFTTYLKQSYLRGL